MPLYTKPNCVNRIAFLTIVQVSSVRRAQGVKNCSPKLGIEQMNKVPRKIEISYLLVEIFERPLSIPKRPSIENIGILYNYGPGVRGTNAQRLPSPI